MQKAYQHFSLYVFNKCVDQYVLKSDHLQTKYFNSVEIRHFEPNWKCFIGGNETVCPAKVHFHFKNNNS